MAQAELFGSDAYVRWARYACTQLDARREEINALNVFPVPDADTGSNMAFTMKAAVAAMDRLLAEEPHASMRQIAETLAHGAVRGARGNSGVVLSQILASLAAAAARAGHIDGPAIIDALTRAETMVTSAITEPVEGTVITVIRATARAVAELTDQRLATVAAVARQAARTALHHTPSQLEVLREAGVVDAGGQGFVLLLETLCEIVGLHGQRGTPTQSVPSPGDDPQAAPTVDDFSRLSDTVQTAEPGTDQVADSEDSLRPVPSTRPNSSQAAAQPENKPHSPTRPHPDTTAPLAAGSGEQIGATPGETLAIHTDTEQGTQRDGTPLPPAASAEGEGHGTANPHLEVMGFVTCHQPHTLDDVQQALRTLGDSLVIARATAATGTVHIHTREAGRVVETLTGFGSISDLRFELLPDGPHTRPIPRAVIAIVPPGRLAELYRSAGAVVVHPIDPDSPVFVGGGITRPSDTVSAIVAAARTSKAKEIILLPNGLLSKRELISAELTSHASEKNLTILPTARLVSGIAALAVHDPSQPIAVDAYAMAEAAGAMTTAVITRVYHADTCDSGPLQPGDLVATSAGATITITRNLTEAITDTCDTLLNRGGELVTLLLTAEAHAAVDVATIGQHLAEVGVDLTVYPADGMDHPVEIGVE
ncbi:DAK2 domain-containing protein [Corynebacterium choanae]|uniref:DAK2 domain protein n=1 Tax=Corynebacterium choanae TaxID=1862358 RepID=A0A3G6J6H6_9CORY|nr:DAK2 domain-containing protein [Corynebacterium choanae]AZA13412.1 DAK2 domain protein [Corynebacterium choanae]